jgi:lysophospholipid acyltransferase (LPLAT)-like uncharacterized protein
VSPLKSILRSEPVRVAVCAVAAAYMRLVHATGSWRVVGQDRIQQYWDAGKPVIVCFWHGRLLMMPYAWRKDLPFHMLISSHRDGQLISRTVGHFGISTVTGSTTRGGAQSTRQIIRLLRSGETAGVTPDGPRGPRMQATAGAVALARLSGAPLIPLAYSTSRRKILGTWDRFLVPFPFGRGVFVWGEPIPVESGADAPAIEQARANLEAGLNAVTAEADRLCGVEVVLPAPREALEAT